MELQENDWLRNYQCVCSLSFSYKYRNGIGVQLKQKKQRRARDVVEQGQAGYILHTLLQVFFFFLTSIHRSMQASVQLVCKGKKFRFWDYEKLSNWCTHFEKFPFENIFNMILWSSLSASKVRLQMPNLRRMKKILKFNSFPITIFCSLQSYLHDYF